MLNASERRLNCPDLVEEIARKQQSEYEDQQQAQKKGGAVEFDWLLIRILIPFHRCAPIAE